MELAYHDWVGALPGPPHTAEYAQNIPEYASNLIEVSEGDGVSYTWFLLVVQEIRHDEDDINTL